LSEETDAPVVIVSEESGAISYAYKGQLVRGVSIEELRAFLTSVLVHPTREPGLWGWLRSRGLEHNQHSDGTTVITRNDVRPPNSGGGK
jgi:hypothetical protein